MSTLSRRRALGLLGAGGALCASGCLPTETASAPDGPADVSATIATNHGHVAVVTGAELLAGRSVVLDIRGSAQSHTHRVDLSSEQLAAIRSGWHCSAR